MTLAGLIDRSIRVPPDLAAQSGLLPDQVKINEKYGGGFPANVEGLHQLHCLVRHSSFFTIPADLRICSLLKQYILVRVTLQL